MQRSVQVVVILAMGIVISSCGGARVYEGEQLPAREVATLVWTPSLGLSGQPADVREIDGVAVSIWNDHAEVLPGKHTVSGEVRLRSGTARPVAFSTTFEAEAGHTYDVLGHCPQENECTATVTDRGMTAQGTE